METRQEIWRIYRETILILFISLCGGLFAGLVLEGILDTVAEFPGLLVMIPAFLATRGNVYGALGGRISSGLHQGLIPPRFEWDQRLINAVVASLINGIGISIIIGVFSWGILQVLNRASATLIEFLGIVLIAGVLTSIVMIVGLLGLIFMGYRMGYDPDNLVGPIVTTLGDIFGMLFLLIAVTVVGVIT